MDDFDLSQPEEGEIELESEPESEIPSIELEDPSTEEDTESQTEEEIPSVELENEPEVEVSEVPEIDMDDMTLGELADSMGEDLGDKFAETVADEAGTEELGIEETEIETGVETSDETVGDMLSAFEYAEPIEPVLSAERPSRRTDYPFPVRTPVLPDQQLEDMLGKIGSEEMLSLFNYFKTMTRSLPESPLSEYLLSEQRVKLEYVIDRLSGKKGLMRDAHAYRRRKNIPPSPGDAEVLPLDFNGAVEFLHSVIRKIPDEGFVVTLSNKLDRIKDKYTKKEE